MTELLDPRDIPIPIAYLRLLLAHFGSRPDLRDAILEGSGISEGRLRDGAQFLTLEELRVPQDNLARLLGNDWAISAPDLWTHSTYGALGLGSQSAPDLREALQLIISNSAAIGALWRYRLDVAPTLARFHYDLNANIAERYWQWGLEIGFIGLRSLFYLYLSRPPSEARFLFRCASPPYADRLIAVLGTDVVFDAGTNAIEFPTAWLGKASPLQNPVAFRLANWQLEAENVALSQSGHIRMRVERLLQAKPNGRATLPETASVLGFSERTLVRRLRDENTSFRMLLDTELKRRAEEMLRSQSLNMEEIAEQLGYSDSPSLARARRRWVRRYAGGLPEV